MLQILTSVAWDWILVTSGQHVKTLTAVIFVSVPKDMLVTDIAADVSFIFTSARM